MADVSSQKEHDLSSGLSEYEKQRLKRIEANESFLKSLNLFDVSLLYYVFFILLIWRVTY